MAERNSWKLLNDAITDTAEAHQKGIIELIKTSTTKKAPIGTKDKWNYTVKDLAKNGKNYGVFAGFNHEKNGYSLACIDVDGFKIDKLNKGNIATLTEEQKEYLFNLSSEDAKALTQQTREDMFTILKKAFPKALISISQSNGYHFFIFNRTQPSEEVNAKDHFTSRSICFPNDYKIEMLRGVSFFDFLEIFCENNRWIMCPTSKVKLEENNYKPTYYRLHEENTVNRWQDIDIVDNVNELVKKAFVDANYGSIEEDTPSNTNTLEVNVLDELGIVVDNTPKKKYDFTLRRGELIKETIEYLKKIYNDSKGSHRTVTVCLTTIFYNLGVEKKYFLNCLERALLKVDKSHKEEHMKQAKNSWSKSENNQPLWGYTKLKEEAPFITDLVNDMTNNIYKQQPKKVKINKKNETPDNVDDDETDEIAEAIELRKNPSSIMNYEKAKSCINNIKKEGGLIPYLDNKIKNIMKGSRREVYRKTFKCFNVMNGEGTGFIQTFGNAGIGKTFSDKVVIEDLIPNIYVETVNNPTFASFTRAGKNNPEYYNRLIYNVGDVGTKKDQQAFEEIQRVFKILFTEKYFKRTVTSEDKKTVFDLELKIDSGACISTSVLTNKSNKKGEGNDVQMESRSLISNPDEVDEDDIMDFNSYLDYDKSPKAIAKKKAQEELKEFKHYLLYKVVEWNKWKEQNKEIVIGHYNNVFKRLSKGYGVAIRNHQQIMELFKTYCFLTDYECNQLTNGDLIATKKQLEDFCTNIWTDTAMHPINYNLIKLIKNGKSREKKEGYNIRYYSEDTDEALEDMIDDFNDVFDDMKVQKYPINDDDDDDDGTEQSTLTTYVMNYEDLPYNKQSIFVNKLMDMNKLKTDNGGSFFTVETIKALFRNYKAYKDIDDLHGILTELYTDGYVGKLPFRHDNHYIYYFTNKTKELGKKFEITEEDESASKQWIQEVGITIK